MLQKPTLAIRWERISVTKSSSTTHLPASPRSPGGPKQRRTFNYEEKRTNMKLFLSQ